MMAAVKTTAHAGKGSSGGVSAGVSSERPVDLVHLARYTFGDRTLEHEVLQLFRCQSRIYLERLRQAGDDKVRADIAHTIKGSARSIGAWSVVKWAEAIEQVPSGRNAKAEAITALEHALGEVDDFIDRLVTADR